MNKIVLLLSLLFLALIPASAQQTDTATAVQTDSLKACNNRAAVTVIYERPRLSDRAVSVFTSVLDGQIAGLQSTNGGGQPGAAPELLIRGIGSLFASTEPLLVVNGAVYSGNIASLNLHDIETITVLKDAVATAAYGNRGANGVLEIVTKEKADHGHKLSLDVKTGIVTRGIGDYDKLQAKEYYETVYTAIGGASRSVVEYLGGYNAFNVPDNELFTAEGKINPKASLKYDDDWVQETQRIGFKQDYNIATSGTGKKGNYYLAGGYLSEKGYIKSTGFERGNLSFNGTLKVLSWLKAGLFATGALGSRHFIDREDTMYNPFYVARLMPAAFPVYYRNANGAKEKDPVTGKDKYDWGSIIDFPSSSMGNRLFAPTTNAAGTLDLDNRQHKFGSFLVSPYIEIIFLKQFTYHTSFHYNYNRDKELLTYNPYYGDGANTNGRSITSIAEDKIHTLRQTLTWKPGYENHHPKIKAGYEGYGLDQEYISTTVTGNSTNVPQSRGTHSRIVEGLYLNGDYDFKEKYYFSAGLRRDRSSNLANGRQWATYWAVGASYDISKENFLKHSDWIDQLKVRASYGIQGLSGLEYSDSLYTEKIRHLNMGIDFNTFNNRLCLTLDAYYKNNPSTTLVIPPAVPGGFPFLTNLQIENKGLEITLRAFVIRSSKAYWSIRLNATYNKNKITPLADIAGLPNGSVYDLYLPEYAGPDPASGQATYYINLPNGRFTTSDYGLLQGKDQKNWGSAQPDLYGSLINRVSYKKFELAVQLTYSLGGKYYDQVYADLMGNGLNGTWSPDILNHWTPQNTATYIPRVNIQDQYANARSDRFLKNASYMNIKNVYLGYNFAPIRLKKAKLKTLTLYLTAENLWLFTASKGMDPQASFDGMGRYNYLPARTIMVGINAGL